MATKKLRLATAVLAAVAAFALAVPFTGANTQAPATAAGDSQTATLNVGDFDW